jgi:hypothetical protein
MTDSHRDPVRLAETIARQLDHLAEHLFQAPPRQAAQILGRILDTDEGILGRLATLVATASRCAKNHATAGVFPPEVWLALGRAANDLDDLCVDLDEQTEDLRHLARTPQPGGTGRPPAPAASALMGGRHR